VENCKVDIKSCTAVYKLCPFEFISGLQNLNPGSKLKYKEFLVQMAKAWATYEIQAAQMQSDTGSV
jgi:hypothetical protein